MTDKFDSFVLFAEMRTGSNFLETNLNALEGVRCFGEAFNPFFIGWPNASSLLGCSLQEREADPLSVLEKIRSTEGVTGFRFFHDHDSRILDAVLNDERCAKIILSRNPMDSYVSWKIAQNTGQWMLKDIARRKDAKAHFDPIEFAEHFGATRSFQAMLRERLHHTGQVPLNVRYDDLQSLDLLNGLARFLGVSARLEKLDKSLKVQNPAALADKVANIKELEATAASLVALDTDAVAEFEPSRAAAVTTYVTAARTPLVYLPVRGGPQDVVTEWLAHLDDVTPEALPTQMSQKDLRQWKRGRPGHRSFTVIRHPVARAHHVYCSYVLGCGPVSYTAIRHKLSQQTGGAIPHDGPAAGYDLAAHRTGFMAFLEFLRANLNGQSSIRVDAVWCSQSQVVNGFASFALPDMILREDALHRDLPDLAKSVGARDVPSPAASAPDTPFSLDQIYDQSVEQMTRKVYQRDYMMFGFDKWAD